MARYNIYLAELPNWGLGLKNAYAPIRSTLQGWFDQVVKKAGGFEDCWVQWCGAPPSIQPHELLVYFLSSRSSTLIRAFGDKGAQLGPDGTTSFKKGGGEAVSEVYVKGNQGEPKLLAALAFHELMHNKLRMTNELHQKGGGGLAAEVVTAASELTSKNRDVMAAKLATKAPQWLGGWHVAADPLSDAGK